MPAILEFLPYRKRDITVFRDEITYAYFAENGYVGVRVDMRGCGDSTGDVEDEYSSQEQRDACQVIEWIARQPWCTGKVGMMGISWGGFNSLQVAYEQPEALKAIIPICFTDDRYANDIHFNGGVMLMDNLIWAAMMEAINTLPPDVHLSPNWMDMWKRRLQTLPPLAKTWSSHQLRDEYWKHGSVCEDYSKIKAATFLWGGYADGYTNSVESTLQNISCPKRAIIGPWVHLYPHLAHPNPRWGFCFEAVQWWNKHLKDEPMDEVPNLICYIQDHVPVPHPKKVEGRWVAEPQTTKKTLYLKTDQKLHYEPMAADGEISFSTEQTCGSTFGLYFPRDEKEIHQDQSSDDKLSYTFDTDEVKNSYEIVGRPNVQLCIASDKPTANIIIRLCIVDPEGKSRLVGFTGYNLNHNISHEIVTPLAPGEFQDIKAELDFLGEKLNPGYRLRLCLSTAYFPLFLPNPEPVMLTVKLGKCRLEIPILDRWNDLPYEAPEPTKLKPLSTTVCEISEHTKTQELGEAGRLSTIYVKHNRNRFENTGLTTDWRIRQVTSILPDNPTSATLDVSHEMVWACADWTAWMRYEMRFSCDKKNLYVFEKRIAKQNEETVFEKSCDTTVKRHGI